MRVFVTGASGWIGSAVVPELLNNGHEVLGLARSDASAAAIAAAGADVLRGDLEDLESLRKGASETDGVIHLGFIHDFSRFAEVQQLDRAAIDAMADVLEGTNKPLSIASGILFMGYAPRAATEKDTPQVDPAAFPRAGTSLAVAAMADRGIRTSVVRLAPTVHGRGDQGFIAMIVAIARKTGVSAYIGEGSNHWPAVHRLDAATLFRLAIEKAPAGSALHGTAEQGVKTRDIAEAIGRGLNLPVESIAPEKAAEHFEWMGRFFGTDQLSSNAITRELLGWNPTHPTLLEDIDAGYYFEESAVSKYT